MPELEDPGAVVQPSGRVLRSSRKAVTSDSAPSTGSHPIATRGATQKRTQAIKDEDKPAATGRSRRTARALRVDEDEDEDYVQTSEDDDNDNYEEETRPGPARKGKTAARAANPKGPSRKSGMSRRKTAASSGQDNAPDAQISSGAAASSNQLDGDSEAPPVEEPDWAQLIRERKQNLLDGTAPWRLEGPWSRCLAKHIKTRDQVTERLIAEIPGCTEDSVKSLYNAKKGFRDEMSRVRFNDEVWSKMKVKLTPMIQSHLDAEAEAKVSEQRKRKWAGIHAILAVFLSTPVASSLDMEERFVLSINQESAYGLLLWTIDFDFDETEFTHELLVAHWTAFRRQLAELASRFRQELQRLYPRPEHFLFDGDYDQIICARFLPDKHLFYKQVDFKSALYRLRCKNRRCDRIANLRYPECLEHPCVRISLSPDPSENTGFKGGLDTLLELTCADADTSYHLMCRCLKFTPSTTHAEMDALGERIFCHACGRGPFTWTTLVEHYRTFCQSTSYYANDPHAPLAAQASIMTEEEARALKARKLGPIFW